MSTRRSSSRRGSSGVNSFGFGPPGPSFGTARFDQYGNRIPGEFGADGMPLKTAADGLVSGRQGKEAAQANANWDKFFPGVKTADTTAAPAQSPVGGISPASAHNDINTRGASPAPAGATAASTLPKIGDSRTTAFGGTETLMPSQGGPRWVGSTTGAPPATNFMPGDAGTKSLADHVQVKGSTVGAPLTGPGGTRATDAANLANAFAVYAPHDVAPANPLQSESIQHALDDAAGTDPAKIAAVAQTGKTVQTAYGPIASTNGSPNAAAGTTPQGVKNDIPPSAMVQGPPAPRLGAIQPSSPLVSVPSQPAPAVSSSAGSQGYVGALDGGAAMATASKAAGNAVVGFVGRNMMPGGNSATPATDSSVSPTLGQVGGIPSPVAGAAAGLVAGSTGGGGAPTAAPASLKRQFTVAPDDGPQTPNTTASTTPAEVPNEAAGFVPPGFPGVGMVRKKVATPNFAGGLTPTAFGEAPQQPMDAETTQLRGNDVAAREASGMPAATYAATGPGTLNITPTNYARGFVPPGMSAAMRREKTAIAHHIGGAKRGDKPEAVQFPGVGPAVINTGEKVVPNAAGGQPAVLNRDMMKKSRTAFGQLVQPLKRAVASQPKRADLAQTSGWN